MDPSVAANIPRPALSIVRNVTPFAHFWAMKMGPGRRYYDVVVVKGSFVLAPEALAPAEEQSPVRLADEPLDPSRAERSSLRYAGDLHLPKPGTDVIVTGTARAPEGRSVPRWDVAVVVTGRLGTVVSQHARVCGPRAFEPRLLGWSVGEPAATREVPIRYELAYGGAFSLGRRGGDQPSWDIFEENPSGLGHQDPRAMDERQAYPAPQWESLADPITAPGRATAVAGFGPIARSWRQRVVHVGTCDAAWLARTREEAQRNLPPDYPADFDPRFFHAAHPSLRTASPLAGDEQLGLAGLVAERPLFVTHLPGTRVIAHTATDPGRWSQRTLPLDTVHVDLDARRVHLTWRLALDHREGVRGVVLGEPLPGRIAS